MIINQKICGFFTSLQTYLKLSQLLHELLLSFTVAEGRDDVEEHLEQVQTLPRDTGQGKDGRDAAEAEHKHVIRKNKQ